MTKRFCQATENNKAAILQVLKHRFAHVKKVLEIGSGTGQHAVHFAPVLSHLVWQTTDMLENHETILAWMEEFPSHNLPMPLEYRVGKDNWPMEEVDAVFTANTAHIMPPHVTRVMMEVVGQQLPEGGVFCQYGPFNVNGDYTSEGNRTFDVHLKSQGCGGIRDIDELRQWAGDLKLVAREVMPANNFLLVWHKS